MTVDILKVQSPNPDSKRWCTRFLMTDMANELWQRGHSREDFSPFMSLLIDELAKVPGVVWIYLSAYELHICKAPLFEWSEIEPFVDSFLEMVKHNDQ